MKAFTDLDQSLKLAEILPIESADMYYHPYPNDEDWYDIPNFGEADLKFNQLPCWSLAALLDVLPKGKVLIDDVHSNKYKVIGYNLDTDYYDEPLDAYVAMILKLKEKNLL